jgi:F0F1-type ATP synthase gamma subunit
MIEINNAITDITHDNRTELLLRSLKTLKDTRKQKISDKLYIIYNNYIVTMAKTISKNNNLKALYYHDSKKEIIIVKHNTKVTFDGDEII